MSSAKDTTSFTTLSLQANASPFIERPFKYSVMRWLNSVKY